MSLQSEIDAAHAAGGGTVVVPPGRHVLTQQLVVKQGVILQGTGRVAFDYRAGRPTFGTIFDPQFGYGAGSSGDAACAAIVMQSGSSCENFGFDYSMQDPAAAAPIEFGSSIQPFDPVRNEYGITIRDIHLGRSYVGIDCRNSHGISNLMVSGIVGCPIMSGLAIDGVTDWCTIRDLHFNSGFMATEGHPGHRAGLTAWSCDNGIALQLGGNDWLQPLNVQLFGYRVGVRVLGGAVYQHGMGPYSFLGLQVDACWHGIELGGLLSHTVQVIGAKFSPYSWITRAAGCALSTLPGAQVKGVQFIGCYEFGLPLFGTWLDGAEDVIEMGNIVRTAGSEGAAFTAMNGRNIQIAGNIAQGFAMPTHTAGSSNVVQRDNQ